MFKITENVGIAGGKDHLALYLVGMEDLSNPKAGLFYLDPHFIQTAIPGNTVNKDEKTQPLR